MVRILLVRLMVQWIPFCSFLVFIIRQFSIPILMKFVLCFWDEQLSTYNMLEYLKNIFVWLFQLQKILNPKKVQIKQPLSMSPLCLRTLTQCIFHCSGKINRSLWKCHGELGLQTLIDWYFLYFLCYTLFKMVKGKCFFLKFCFL